MNQMYCSKYEKIPPVSKENGFTALRILCSLIVVYEHFVILTNFPIPSLELRGIAVKIFFILSGFWVTRSLFTSETLKVFYLKRIKKIFPFYLLVVFASAFFLVFLSSFDVSSYFKNPGFWKYLIANITTLNFVHPSLPGVFNGEPVNGSLWTIKIELGFYIILPVVIFFCLGKNEYKKGRCIITLSFFYLLSVIYIVTVPFILQHYNLSESLTNQLPAFVNYFSIGILCFFFYDSFYNLWHKLIISGIILLVLCYILKNTIVTAIIEPLALGIITMWGGLKFKPFFLFYKVYDFSYILYLIHYPIIMVIKQFL